MKIILLITLFIIQSAKAKDIVFERQVKRVIDGDTIELKTDEESGLIAYLGYNIRLLGIDTPELHSKSKCEKQLATNAKKYLEQLLKPDTPIKIINPKWDKYGGRINAYIEVGGENITKKLIKEGYGIEYYGDKKVIKWCND